MNSMSIELALTTSMRCGEVCALRWSDFDDAGAMTVSHALGNGRAASTSRSPRPAASRAIPLTSHTTTMLRAMRADARRAMDEMGMDAGDPYILGTQVPGSRPYNPMQLGKDFSAFCRMDGFSCTFHDPRHTFATMMIAGGCDVRTVASYLGHASVSMTLDTCAGIDPEAKCAAVGKVDESFDVDMSAMGFDGPERSVEANTSSLTFTVEQLEAMLAEAKRREAGHEGA